MDLVKMIICKHDTYNALETKNPNALYFISDPDVQVVYKGDAIYTGKIVRVDVLPTNPAQGTLYILSTDGIGRIWTGSEWEKITYPVLDEMPETPDNNATLSAKAISDYVAAKISEAISWESI